MGIIDRFLGRKKNADTSKLSANPNIQKPLALNLVFATSFTFDNDALTQALCAYHSSMRKARAELELITGNLIGLVGWGKHVIRLVGINGPMPEDALEACLAPSHYAQEVKAEVRKHQAVLILYYVGYDENPWEQYVALTAVAGALAGFNALAIINEDARTSLPVGMFSHAELGKESLDILRSLPPTMLFCGFVKYNIEDTEGVWMRTYGADLLGANDLAVLAQGHHEGSQYAELFDNVLSYQFKSGAVFAAGHTMQIGESTYMKFRDPLDEEYFLQDPKALVVETISADQINN